MPRGEHPRHGSDPAGPHGDGAVELPAGRDVLIISDATGATVRSVLSSVLVQFEDAQFTVRRFPFVRRVEQLDEILSRNGKDACVVVYTLVSSALRAHVRDWGRDAGCVCVDVLGPLLDSFAQILHHGAQEVPGAFHHGDEQEGAPRLAEAIAFTLAHDDGKGLESLDQADLVILGASRTGKTPTSIFLSCRQLKVANVPIIKGIALPDQVIRARVPTVGFRIQPGRLMELRAARMKRFERRTMRGYLSRDEIDSELRYCERLYRQIPDCHTIDVTSRSVEETSEWIVRIVL